VFTWDASVDLQGDAVTYDVQWAPTPDFPVATTLSRSALTGPSVSVPALANGTWFLKVTSRDAKGNVQEAFDRVIFGGKTYFGAMGFTVAGTTITRF
jgi:hypothetical protein